MSELIAYAVAKAQDFTEGGTNKEKVEILSKLLTDNLTKVRAGSSGDMAALVDFYDAHLSPTPHIKSDKNCPTCTNAIRNCFEGIENFFSS